MWGDNTLNWNNFRRMCESMIAQIDIVQVVWR